MSEPRKTTAPMAIAAAWIVVATPLGWGIYQTAIKALPLFSRSSVPTPPRPPAATTSEKPSDDRQRWTGKPTPDPVR